MSTLNSSLLSPSPIGAHAWNEEPRGMHVQVMVEGFYMNAKSKFHLRTWLFHYTETTAVFNAEDMDFQVGMRVTLVSAKNHRVEGRVSWIKQYSISSHQVGVDFDMGRSDRPPIAAIFG